MLKTIDDGFPRIVSEGYELENQIYINFFLELNTSIGFLKEMIYAVNLPKDGFEPVEQLM